MIIPDSSVLIAYYYEGDSQHSKAFETIRSKEASRLLVNDFIIDEVVTVLQLKAGYEKASMVLELLLNNESVEFQSTPKEEFFEIAEYFKKQKSKLSFTDCSIVLLARRSGARIITFDKKLDEIEKNLKS